MRDPTAAAAIAAVEAEEDELLVPVAVIRPIVDEWLQRLEDDESNGYERLAAGSDVSADTWRRRLSESTYEGRRGTRLPRGWWALDAIDIRDVDFLLTVADLEHLWHTDPRLSEYSGRRELVCEDCGKPIEPGDYRPLELMRPDPEALEGRIWDDTTKKWRQPHRARAGGRRWRWWDLCTDCAATALRSRDGRDRGKPPKRGGRPRLLTDDELRSLHVIYEQGEMSMRELAKQLVATRDKGSQTGYEQSIMYGWRRLGLPIRSRSEERTLVHRKAGRMGRPEPRRCGARRVCYGKHALERCKLWAIPGSDFCWNHTTFGITPRSERRRLCTGTVAKTGERCTRTAREGSDYCRYHDPLLKLERQVEMKRWRARQPLRDAGELAARLRVLVERLQTRPRPPGKYGAPQWWPPIVEATGINQRTLAAIADGTTKRVQRKTHDKLVAALDHLERELPPWQ